MKKEENSSEEQKESHDDTQKNKPKQDADKQDKNQNQEEQDQKLEQDYKDLKQTLQRTHADFQNYKKRVKKQKIQHTQQAQRKLMKDILPFLDNMELALQNAGTYEDLKESMSNNFQQLLETLEKHGLTQIQTKTYNPNQHEVILTQPTTNKDKHNTITNNPRTGYKLHDNILRSAQVTVAQYKEEQENE